MEKNRNYFIAIGLSVVIVLAWQFLYMNPRMEAQQRAAEAQQALQQQQNPTFTPESPGAATTTGNLPGAGQAQATATREQALAKSQRVAIDTPAVAGSINLTGARFDDLKLREYHETVDDSSPIITLFSPADTKDGYFGEVGYIGSDTSGAVPGPGTVWTLASGEKLTTTTPVTLSFTNEKGVVFNRTISIDDHYMISMTDKVENPGAEAITLSSYGRITRNNKPVTPSVWVIHEGFLGVPGKDGSLSEHTYSNIEEEAVTNAKATGG